MRVFGVLGAVSWDKVEAFGQEFFFFFSSINVLMMDKVFFIPMALSSRYHIVYWVMNYFLTRL
jgi:hypothetical protein